MTKKLKNKIVAIDLEMGTEVYKTIGKLYGVGFTETAQVPHGAVLVCTAENIEILTEVVEECIFYEDIEQALENLGLEVISLDHLGKQLENIPSTSGILTTVANQVRGVCKDIENYFEDIDEGIAPRVKEIEKELESEQR